MRATVGTTETFERLLAPGRIGPLALPNRVVLPAMDMNHCDDGAITDAEIAHYVARARGGAGLLITGSAAVAYPHGAASRRQPGLSDDRFLPGLRRLADAVHGAGGRLCVQLTHHGKLARVDMADGRPLLVPSGPEGELDLSSLRDNTPDELLRLAAASGGRSPTYKVAGEEDLAWLVDRFAEAADRVARAGADAVEVHAGHGYVLSSFLSAGENRRDDRWGGPIENRARLAVEVVRAVRAAVGPDLAVLVRLTGGERGEPGGITLDDAVAAARLLEAAGADAIHVTGYGRNPFADFTLGPLPAEPGAYREDARAVKAAVGVPVVAVGRISPELAEEMLAAGDCDFVSMGRQHLTDPDVVAKLRAGRRASIRPCINCYVCVEQNFFDAPPRCAVNPAVGDEAAGRLEPAAARRHVVVVGGGPAGLECARVAAERGHRVTLLEAGDRLGGTAWFSQLTTPANGPFVDWLVHEVRRLGVDVGLGRRAGVHDVLALDPDAVVVATGATRGRPAVPGADLPHVRTGDDLRALLTGERPSAAGEGAAPAAGLPWWARAALSAGRRLGLTADPERVRRLSRRWLPLGRRVVVLGGGLVGLELAELLAERGRAVTVLEPGPHAGLPMASPRRWARVRAAARHGARIVREAAVVAIEPGAVVYDHAGARLRVPADDVVVATEVHPGAPLAEALAGRGVEVHVVGDAAEVGYLEGAVRSAWAVATRL